MLRSGNARCLGTRSVSSYEVSDGASARKVDAMSKDPVCGMMIDEATAEATSEYQGRVYYFCTRACKTRFDQDPGRYIGNDR